MGAGCSLVVREDFYQSHLHGCGKQHRLPEGHAQVNQVVDGPLVLSSERSRTDDYHWRTNLMRQTATYCGTTVPQEFISIGGSASVTFVSDASLSGSGSRLLTSWRLAHEPTTCLMVEF